MSSCESKHLTGLRRKAVLYAAAVAFLAAVPGLSFSHGHRFLGFACLGVQVVLLALSISCLARSKTDTSGSTASTRTS
jgi:hypothetical protein